MSPRTVVVSDIHLGAIPEENERAFLAFLRTVGGLGDDLLINGDLFDFWFEYRQVIPRGHFEVLSALRRLVTAGVPTRFLGGNHDGWAGSFLEEEIGIEIVEGPAILTVGGRTAYVAHGDGLGGGDWGYRLLKRASRSRAGRFAFRTLHPDLGIPAARAASSTKKRAAAGTGYDAVRAAHLAAHASSLLRARSELDLVVFGHTHLPRVDEIEPNRYYLNPGDWIHHRTYAVVSSDEVQLHSV